MFSAISIPPSLLAAFGILTLVIIAVQMLIGYRKIKFKGRTHLRVHKAVAWVLITLAALHGLSGLIYLGILR